LLGSQLIAIDSRGIVDFKSKINLFDPKRMHQKFFRGEFFVI